MDIILLITEEDHMITQSDITRMETLVARMDQGSGYTSDIVAIWIELECIRDDGDIVIVQPMMYEDSLDHLCDPCRDDIYRDTLLVTVSEELSPSLSYHYSTVVDLIEMRSLEMISLMEEHRPLPPLRHIDITLYWIDIWIDLIGIILSK
jgi:hypothetical protein